MEGRPWTDLKFSTRVKYHLYVVYKIANSTVKLLEGGRKCVD